MIKIIFHSNLDPRREAEVIDRFLSRDDSRQILLKIHPSLQEIFPIKNRLKRLKLLEGFIIDFRKKNSDIIIANTKTIRGAWRKIENDFFNITSGMAEIRWPNRTIEAYTSINPICPRSLADWMFFFYYALDTKSAIEIIMHESFHFLYFEKWMELYPDAERKTFERPHIEWVLSELVAPIVLNDTVIQTLLNLKAGFYPEHEKTVICGKNAPQLFSEIYQKNIMKTHGFAQFLRESYAIIKKHQNCFQKTIR